MGEREVRTTVEAGMTATDAGGVGAWLRGRRQEGRVGGFLCQKIHVDFPGEVSRTLPLI